MKAFSFFLLLWIAFFFAEQSIHAVSVPKKQSNPDEVIQSFMDKKQMPSLSVLVYKNNQVIYRTAVGLRKDGFKERVTLEDAYHLASNTKTMTAVLAGILVEQGKIQWNSTIDSIFKNDIPYLSQYKKATLEQLLSHTACVPSGLETRVWHGFFGKPKDLQTTLNERKRMAAAALMQKPICIPGSNFNYSNMSYLIAGYMIEKASGKSWEELITAYLFEPLGMKKTGFGTPALSDKTNQPWGHKPAPINPGYTFSDNPLSFGPAGTVHATPEDLLSFAKLFIQGGQTQSGKQIIAPKTILKLTTPVKQSYALGWFSSSINNEKLLYHDGCNTMFYCTLVIIPSKDLIVIVMINRGDEIARAYGIALREYLINHFIRS